ncbi:hypothetical protein C7T94_07265 [Pedobacter yulinensis]|uniref:Uncharacterized protein n=1 Tax=Pedobacter yulinensis TaxID=2126353 RepID=A0A2T3HJ61_9SPHI|nr:hypothetical protein C7T94_07265 [Pedobacter yulinensis]
MKPLPLGSPQRRPQQSGRRRGGNPEIYYIRDSATALFFGEASPLGITAATAAAERKTARR